MTALVIRGDARSLPLPEASVDLIVTSPPYFALRSYTDGGQHYAGQVGDEATPAEFLASLWACTAEWLRVLKPTGSLWVNLGDKYAGSRMDGSSDNGTGATGLSGTASIRDRDAARGQGVQRRDSGGIPTKSLIGIPWRYALGCVDSLGLILRAEVIWSKPNGLPESVTDRVRRSHEQWFHFTKEPRYFSAVDEVREPHGQRTSGTPSRARPWQTEGEARYGSKTEDRYHALGALPGSVWTVPTQPLTVPAHLGVDHFAAFPMEWPRRIIRGWSPAGICVVCGEGRRTLSESTITADRGGRQFNPASGNVGVLGKEREYRITGYACACPDTSAPVRPSVVLDPFGGTGTTALVASTLGRIGISNDLSHDYSRLARWRTTDPGQRAAAMQVEKPPRQIDGQGDLFTVGDDEGSAA